MPETHQLLLAECNGLEDSPEHLPPGGVQSDPEEACGGRAVAHGSLETVEAGHEVDAPGVGGRRGHAAALPEVVEEADGAGPLHHAPRVLHRALRQEGRLLPDPPGHQGDQAVDGGVGGRGEHV